MPRKVDMSVLKRKPKKQISRSDALSTGSTLLNLACSGKTYMGFLKGHFYYLVGDSSSGKTFLSLTCFAEACMNPHFSNYDLIFDDAEDGALMDFAKFFGQRCAERIIAPRYNKEGEPVFSETIQDVYYHLDLARQRGKPVIYVLDSMDAVSSEEEKKKAVDRNNAHRKKVEEGKEVKVAGSYGDGKAKVNSERLRQIVPFVKDTGSIVLFISQTRDNINPFSLDKKTRSGGRALTFYATLEMWSAQAGHIKKKIKDKERELGIKSKIRVKKNRIQGKDRSVEIPIYHSFGIDDIGSCVDYLVSEGHWKKSGGINCVEFGFKGTREEVVKFVEDNELQDILRILVQETWDKIESLCVIHRNKRYL